MYMISSPNMIHHQYYLSIKLALQVDTRKGLVGIIKAASWFLIFKSTFFTLNFFCIRNCIRVAYCHALHLKTLMTIGSYNH